MKRINQVMAATAATLALAACHDDSFVPEPEEAVVTAGGVYSGTLTNDPAGATDFAAIVLDDGSFWTLYGEATASDFTVLGFARGTGIATDGVFASTAGTDFGFTPPADFDLIADYDTEAGTFGGTYTTVAGDTTFEGGPLSFSDYDFSATPALSMLAGTWEVEGTDGAAYTVDVAANGSFDFAEEGGGCTGAGTFTPDAGGRNVFDVSVDFDDVPECALPGGSASGIAISYTITGQLTDQLLAAIDDGDTFGVTLFGTRPTP